MKQFGQLFVYKFLATNAGISIYNCKVFRALNYVYKLCSFSLQSRWINLIYKTSDLRENGDSLEKTNSCVPFMLWNIITNPTQLKICVITTRCTKFVDIQMSIVHDNKIICLNKFKHGQNCKLLYRVIANWASWKWNLPFRERLRG